MNNTPYRPRQFSLFVVYSLTMSGALFGHEQKPEQLLALAASMAQRDMDEDVWQSSILADHMPLPPQPPQEINRSIKVGMAVATLEALENPAQPINVARRTETLVDDTTLRDMFRSRGQEDVDQEELSLVRGMIVSQATVLWDAFVGDDYAQQQLIGRLRAAQTVAEENGVELSEVFAFDDLYTSLVRTQYNPQTFLLKELQLINRMNLAVFVNLLEAMADAQAQAELADGEFGPDFLESAKAEIMEAIFENEDLMKQAESIIVTIRNGGRIIALASLDRFWGEGSHEMVEESVMEKFDTELSDSDGLPELIVRQQRYNDLFATICMENGWDPKALSIDQVRQINTSPAIQALSDPRDN